MSHFLLILTAVLSGVGVLLIMFFNRDGKVYKTGLSNAAWLLCSVLMFLFVSIVCGIHTQISIFEFLVVLAITINLIVSRGNVAHMAGCTYQTKINIKHNKGGNHVSDTFKR